MKVCIFGDSITHGIADVECGGWTERLKAFFWNTWDEYGGINIYSLGIDGDTASGVLVRLEAETTGRRPDLIVFAIGLNDSILSDGREVLSVDEFTGHIQQVVQKGRPITQNLLFIGPTGVDEARTNPVADQKGKSYHNERIKKFSDCIERVCSEHGIPFLPLHDVLRPEDLEDGYHPNNLGHRKIFERVRDFMIATTFPRLNH